jgi:hypothetical protein
MTELEKLEESALADGLIGTFDFKKEFGERNEEMEKKLASMTPEQREKFIEASERLSTW